MMGSDTLDSFARRARAGLPLTGVRIVDCHAHLGAYAPMHTPAAGTAQMVGLMDRLGIEATCASSLTACGSDYRWGNDQVSQAMAACPGRVRGYVVVNPNYPEDTLPEIERCFARAPFIGLKFHPEWHDYPPDGPNYEPALAYAQERGLIVLSHTWGTADYLERLSRRYPNATFIQAHTAAGWRGHIPLDYFRVARARPNVYLDLVISVAWYGALERLVDEVGSERLLFGTDAPFLDPSIVLGRVAFARLPDTDKARILGLNMLEIMARQR
jgi:predicted TIM-barrel fold metal-dependent hydrolase